LHLLGRFGDLLCWSAGTGDLDLVSSESATAVRLLASDVSVESNGSSLHGVAALPEWVDADAEAAAEHPEDTD
jgi:hypothetical protein